MEWLSFGLSALCAIGSFVGFLLAQREKKDAKKSEEAAKEYAQKIESQIEGAKVKVINLVSAVGIHTGLGCLALQVFNEMKD